MTKRKIIGLSISLFILALIIVLFSVVFCLRKQSVTIDGATPIEISNSEIISTAGLKNGKSIFMLDKDQAISNIEAKYPYIKVIQIKTTSVIEINIKVRARHEMYYTAYNENYYVLDEDLKILKTTDTEPTNLTKIKEDTLNITASTKVCDFVGNNLQKNSLLNLYKAMVTTVTKTDGETESYLNREDVCSIIKNVEFETYDTFNKMIITTSYGVKLDIENPTKDLQYKINICFSTIESFIEEAQDKEKSGTIKIYYDLNNKMKCEYY